MRRVAVLLLSLVGFVPGCGLTQTLWLAATEKPTGVQSVQVAPNGSVCILYGVKVEDHAAGGLGPIGPHFLEVELSPHIVFGARRGIVLPAAHMDKVLARARGRSSVELGKDEVVGFVRPRSPASRSDFDPASIPGYGKDWVHVPVSPKGLFPTFPYPRRARGEGAATAGGADTITLGLILPERSGLTPTRCAWRALLTPPALAADAAVDAVFAGILVVILPVAGVGAILGK